MASGARSSCVPLPERGKGIAGVAGQNKAATCCESRPHRFPYNLRMLRRDLEQGSRRAAGLDGAALPFADGAEGDA
jgi:hypothetical protein